MSEPRTAFVKAVADLFITGCLLAAFISTAGAQVPNDSSAKSNDNQIFTYVEQMPQFPGGDAQLMKFLTQNIKYPSLARDSNIEGKVIAKFVVNEDGSISDIKIVKGIGYGCDEEVTRVIKLMPKWKPGKQNNNPVKVYFLLPVSFKLNAEEKDLTKPNIVLPSFPGGGQALESFIAKNLKYPKDARKHAVAGTVILSFEVDEEGNAINEKIYQSVGFRCDEEAERIFHLIKYWTPGMKDRHVTTMPFQMNVTFTLR